MFPNSVWRVVEAEVDEVFFFINFGKAIAGDGCFAGVAIKRSYHHPRLYFLDVI